MTTPNLENTWYALRTIDPKAKDAATSEAELYIYDEIGGWGVHANELIADLKALGEIDTLHLRINSPGGSVIQGNVIYNALKRSKAKVITYIDGLAASMASVIALAGEEVHMADNALYMIHNPWSMAMGDADELRKQADLLDKIKDTILNAYSRADCDREALTALMDAETWFTAEEAKANGFIDVIDGAMEQAAKALDFDLVAKFENKPASAESSEPTEQPAPSKPETDDAPIDPALRIADLESENRSSLEQLTANAIELAEYQDRVGVLTLAIEDFEAKLIAKDEAHATALAEAKQVTDAAIAAQAAELLASTGTPAVLEDPTAEASAESTPEQIREQYEAMEGGSAERLAFFKQHRAIILP